VNLKTISLASAIALVLVPLAARAQSTGAPANSAPPRLQTTFTSPLKIVGSDGHFTVTPRGSSTEWSCAEDQPTEIVAGSPPAIIYRISPDGNVLSATANGGSIKVDVPKAQFAITPSLEATESAPMKALSTLGEGKPTLFGTSPTSGATGFELLYSAAAGLLVSVKTGNQTLGVFTVNAAKWQIGFFPLDEVQSAAEAAGATAPPTARGDLIITGGACKGSPVPGASSAK
jgi:hypothetical protein